LTCSKSPQILTDKPQHFVQNPLRRRGGIIFGVLIATFISWIPNTLVSYWSDDVYPLGGGAGLAGGQYRFNRLNP
jgi:hypothetical protein